MSKDLLNEIDVSENNAGGPRKQKFVTNPTASAVTRYVCISKDAHGTSHSQPLAFWESVRNNGPVVTQHVCSFEESGSDVSLSVASTNAVFKKHVAVIPADAISAFPGFCSVEGLNKKRHRQHEPVSHKQHPAAHIQSCREQQKSTRITPHTWREQIQIIKKEDALAAGGGADTTLTVSAVKDKGLSVNTKTAISETEAQSTLTLHASANNASDIINENNICTSERDAKESHKLDFGVNDRELCDTSVTYEPEVLTADGNNSRTEKFATSKAVKSLASNRRTSTRGNEVRSANFEKKSISDTPKRKLLHNRNKTREYILQQKQKRKERFAAEQSKKNMEDEKKKLKLQTLREKSLRIVKTNVKKSLSKKNSPEKLNNLELPVTSSSHNEKVDDLQSPAVTIKMKSKAQKSFTGVKVTELIPSRVPLSTKSDNDIHVPQKSSLCDSNGGNSNKSSSINLELKENQQLRNELDLKIHTVAKALSAELESSIFHSASDLSDKVNDGSNNLSLQRPLLRLRDTVCSRQPVTHNTENSRMANTDTAVIDISDSPPTKLKRYNHTKQMKSIEKRMEKINQTVSLLRERNIIKSVEQSIGEQTGSSKAHDNVLKEKAIEIEEKTSQGSVGIPQQHLSRGSALPFRTEWHFDSPENSMILLKKRRHATATNNIQNHNHSVTSKQPVLSHVPQMSMEYSSTHTSKSGSIEERENLQPQASKHFDEVMILNYLPSPAIHNLQTVENNIHVTPVKYRKVPELRCEGFKDRQTTDVDSNERTDQKSRLQTNTSTTGRDPVKDSELKIQPPEKLKKLLVQQACQNDQHAAKPPSTRDVITKTPGATAELFMRAVEHETKERAASRIQALYRGHSTRKITAPLLTVTKSKGDVQSTQLLEGEWCDSTKKETKCTEDFSGSKLNNDDSTDWLDLEPIKPCAYNVMTAVRQKLLALKKMSDAQIETKAANIYTDQTLVDNNSGVEGNNTSTQEQNKEICTSGLWVQDNAAVHENIAPATEKRRKVQTVQLKSAKEYSSFNAEVKSGNRKRGSNKSYVFSEEPDWIESDEPEQNGIGSSQLGAQNKTNIMQQSRNNSDNLALPDVHLIRKRRYSENGTTVISNNSKESCPSGVNEGEKSLSTNKEDWIEASAQLSSIQTSLPTETSNKTKNNEDETRYKESITNTKSDHGSKHICSRKTISSMSISETPPAESSSTRCSRTLLESETKKTVSASSGSSASASRSRHDFRNVLGSGKMLPPEALHLQFQAEMNLLESLEESRLRLAQIEGLHTLSLIQSKNRIVSTQKKDTEEQLHQAESVHQQHPSTKHDKFDENRRKFNIAVESMRQCAIFSGVEDPEILDSLTFADVSSPEKEAKSEIKCEKQDKKSKYSYDSSFTSVSEDISGHASSPKSKHSKCKSVSDSTVSRTLDAALKKGYISMAAYAKYLKLISDEATRRRQKDNDLDTFEQSLIDQFMTDMESLETNKRELKLCGKENLTPSIKKKQRALILKLDNDREHIKRLRKTYVEESLEWKNRLLQQLTLAKYSGTDNETLGKVQQERVLKSTTCVSAEPENSIHSDTPKSVVPSTSALQTEVSSSIKTELSQHSAQSTRPTGSGSWSSSQKTENSVKVQSNVDVSTDLMKMEAAAQTDATERRQSLLPSKRLWSHDTIIEWQQSPDEDRRGVRPIRYPRDHSNSPMRILKTAKQHTSLSGSADSIPMENNSEAACFDSETVCERNSSSGRALSVIDSNDRNGSASQKIAATVSSVDVLFKRSDTSVRVAISPHGGMKRQSSGSDESIMLSQGDTPSEQSDLEGRVCALREQLRRRELEAEQLKQLTRARREKLKATEQSLLKQIQALDSYIARTKEELNQDFSTSPLPAVRPKIKQPRVRIEQNSKHVLDKTKEKSLPHKQSEQNSNHVVDKAKWKSLPAGTSQESVANDISTEIPTLILSEQSANSVTLTEDTNNITLGEVHTSEDDSRRDYTVSLSSSFQKSIEAPNSTKDYLYDEKNTVKPKIKQSQVQAEQSSKHVFDKTKEKSQAHKNNKQNSKYFLDKAEYKLPPAETSQKSVSNATSTEIPTVVSSEQTVNSVTFLPEYANSSTLIEVRTSEKDNHQGDILSVPGSYDKSEDIPDWNDHIPVEKNAIKSTIKQPQVSAEQNSKLISDKIKGKSESHKQTEQNSNRVLNRVGDQLPPAEISRDSVSNGTSAEIPTVILSEQTVNSVTFLPEDTNSTTLKEVHTSEEDNDQVDTLSASNSYKKSTEAPDSTEDYTSNDKRSYTENENATNETSPLKETSPLISGQQSSIHVSARDWCIEGSIIPARDASADHFLEESDRDLSEILVDSSKKCKVSKDEYVQDSSISSTLKPCDKSPEIKSNNMSSSRLNISVKSPIAHSTGSKSCTSTTINEELSEITETSPQISDFADLEKASSVDNRQHEDSVKRKLDFFENLINITNLVSTPQNIKSDKEYILTSEIEVKNASSISATEKEEMKDNTQAVLLSTENKSQPSVKEVSEDCVLSVYSDNTNHDREFRDSSSGSICRESHPPSMQLNSTFVVEHEECASQDKAVELPAIPNDSEENKKRMQKLKLVDSIADSILRQLLNDSFVVPDNKLDIGVPNGNASRKPVLSDAHKYSETLKQDIGLEREIQPNSITMLVDESEKQNLAIEQEPNTIDDVNINNATFLLDESATSQENTSVLVDEMLSHFLNDATSDVLNIYNTKMLNRPCVHSKATKESAQCPSVEISESFHSSKKVSVMENDMQDMISFTSPDNTRVQELELSAEDELKSVSEHPTCEKLMSRPDCEKSCEAEMNYVLSESLITNEGDSQLHHRLTKEDEAVMSDGHLTNGCKSKVATQNGNKLKDTSHLQKVEVRGRQTLNNETFPPGWFDEDLDLSNSWREAEQLRLQQLHIEQEIRRLEEQQHQQQALVLVREIPDKPPPPYTPRGTTLQSSSPLYPPPAIGASAPRHRLIELVAEATPILTSTTTPPMLPPEDFCTNYNSSIRRFVFDLSRSLVNEAISIPGTDDDCGQETAPQQITVKRSQEAVRAHVTRRATSLLEGSAGTGPSSAGKLRRLAVGPRWRRRDHVDELLVREARDEEPGWIDYRLDEAHLRNETACSLLHDLLDDTVTAVTTAIARRVAVKTTGVM